jgi:hypothetical protein
MLLEYRTIEGEVITYYLDIERGVTINDIDALATQYLAKTGRIPEGVFLRADVFSQLMKDVAATMRYQSGGTNSGATAGITAFWLTIGHIYAKPIVGAYVPVLVGSAEEYKDNDWYRIFEEVVLDA